MQENQNKDEEGKCNSVMLAAETESLVISMNSFLSVVQIALFEIHAFMQSRFYTKYKLRKQREFK